MTAVLALYLSLVTFGNITDYATNLAFVEHVLSMDSTFRDPALMWRAITSPVAQNVFYIAVIMWELLTSAVLVWATVLWVRACRNREFSSARKTAMIGFMMILILFAGGFIAVGGEWFAMWQSKQWNGIDAAFRNTVLALFGLVMTQLCPPRESGRDCVASEQGDVSQGSGRQKR
jgi:predicted small integral membrane protein